MANSYLEQPAGSGTNVKIEFGGEYTYSLSRNLFKANTSGYPQGKGQLVSGGHNVAQITVVGAILVTDTQTPHKILWDKMDTLVEKYTSTKQVSRLRLYTDDSGGYIEVDGWVDGYNATASADDGHAVIKVTFDFVIQSKNTANLN